MKKHLYFLVLFLGLGILLPNNLFAQSWLWAYGGSGHGNVEVHGISNQSVINDAFGHVYTMAYNEIAPYYTIVGTDTIYQGAFIVKHDRTTGSVIWVKHNMKGITTHALSMVTDHSGNLYVACQFYDTAFVDSYVLPSKGGYDILVMKLDSSGNVIWAKSAGGTAADNSESIAIDSAGNIYVTGGTKSVTIFFDMDSVQNNATDISYLAKYEGNSGNLIWAKSIVANPPITLNTQVRSCSMTVDQANNLYITGDYKKANAISFDGDTLVAPGATGFFLLKADTAGSVNWIRTHKNLTSTHVQPDLFGNLYLTGLFSISDTLGANVLNPVGPTDVFLAKYDTTGSIGWAKSGGNQMTAILENGLVVDDTGYIYMIAGYYWPDTFFNFQFGDSAFDVVNPKDPVHIVKIDSQGHIICHMSISSGGDDYISLMMDEEGSLYVFGDYIDSCKFGATTLDNPTTLETYYLAKLIMPCPHSTEYINSVKSNNALVLSPNPASTSLRISAPYKIKTIVVTNITGQVLFHGEYDAEQVQMNIFYLQAGIYFLKVNDVVVAKFVKE